MKEEDEKCGSEMLRLGGWTEGKENNDLDGVALQVTWNVHDGRSRKSYDWTINDQFTLRQVEHGCVLHSGGI